MTYIFNQSLLLILLFLFNFIDYSFLIITVSICTTTTLFQLEDSFTTSKTLYNVPFKKTKTLTSYQRQKESFFNFKCQYKEKKEWFSFLKMLSKEKFVQCLNIQGHFENINYNN